MVDTDDSFLRISDGTDWYIVPRQTTAIEDLTDNSGGTISTPAEIYVVNDVASAADAIAVLAAKVNELLLELRAGKMIQA